MTENSPPARSWKKQFLDDKVSGLTFHGWIDSSAGPVDLVTRMTWEDGLPVKAENWKSASKDWWQNDEFIYRIIRPGGPGMDRWVWLSPEQAGEVIDGWAKPPDEDPSDE